MSKITPYIVSNFNVHVQLYDICIGSQLIVDTHVEEICTLECTSSSLLVLRLEIHVHAYMYVNTISVLMITASHQTFSGQHLTGFGQSNILCIIKANVRIFIIISTKYHSTTIVTILLLLEWCHS